MSENDEIPVITRMILDRDAFMQTLREMQSELQAFSQRISGTPIIIPVRADDQLTGQVQDIVRNASSMAVNVGVSGGGSAAGAGGGGGGALGNDNLGGINKGINILGLARGFRMVMMGGEAIQEKIEAGDASADVDNLDPQGELSLARKNLAEAKKQQLGMQSWKNSAMRMTGILQDGLLSSVFGIKGGGAENYDPESQERHYKEMEDTAKRDIAGERFNKASPGFQRQLDSAQTELDSIDKHAPKMKSLLDRLKQRKDEEDTEAKQLEDYAGELPKITGTLEVGVEGQKAKSMAAQMRKLSQEAFDQGNAQVQRDDLRETNDIIEKARQQFMKNVGNKVAADLEAVRYKFESPGGTFDELAGDPAKLAAAHQLENAQLIAARGEHGPGIHPSFRPGLGVQPLPGFTHSNAVPARGLIAHPHSTTQPSSRPSSGDWTPSTSFYNMTESQLQHALEGSDATPAQRDSIEEELSRRYRSGSMLPRGPQIKVDGQDYVLPKGMSSYQSPNNGARGTINGKPGSVETVPFSGLLGTALTQMQGLVDSFKDSPRVIVGQAQ